MQRGCGKRLSDPTTNIEDVIDCSKWIKLTACLTNHENNIQADFQRFPIDILSTDF